MKAYTPTLTHIIYRDQLKKLGGELVVLLVERTSRQVVMTEAGTAITEQARSVLAQVKAIHERAQSFHDPMAGDLHVGLIPTVAPQFFASDHACTAHTVSKTEALIARIPDGAVTGKIKNGPNWMYRYSPCR